MKASEFVCSIGWERRNANEINTGSISCPDCVRHIQYAKEHDMDVIYNTVTRDYTGVCFKE